MAATAMSEPGTRPEWDAVRAERDQLRAHILDIDAHATPYGDLPEDPGYVGVYLLSAGALHRALGKIGRTAPSCPAEAQLAEAAGEWQWGVHVVVPKNPNDPDDQEHQHDEWWGAEAEARRWLHTPRQGPVRLSLIRRRPAKPAGLVEPVTDEEARPGPSPMPHSGAQAGSA